MFFLHFLVIKTLDPMNPDPQHCRNLNCSSYREERERLTGEKVAQLLCPDEEEIPSQEEAVRYLHFFTVKGASAVRYLSLQGKELQLSGTFLYRGRELQLSGTFLY